MGSTNSGRVKEDDEEEEVEDEAKEADDENFEILKKSTLMEDITRMRKLECEQQQQQQRQQGK